MVLLTGLVPVVGWQSPAAAVPTAGPSGVAGGGFQNVLALAPSASSQAGRLLMGADVAGFSRSDDGGVTWQPSNNGLQVQDYRAIAGIEWSRTGNEVFAVVGGGPGNPGAVVWSKNNGATWQGLYERAQNDPKVIHEGANMQTRPRDTGRLIAWITPDLFYAGGTNGLFVMRRSTGGVWCQTISDCGPVTLPGSYPHPPIRSLAYRPDAADSARAICTSPPKGRASSGPTTSLRRLLPLLGR